MGSDWVQFLSAEPQGYEDGKLELEDGTIVDLNEPSPWLITGPLSGDLQESWEKFDADRAHDVGVTPYREGTDSPERFYDTPRAHAFEQDARAFSEREGMKFGSLERTGGVWSGGAEPSYQLHVHDGDSAAERVMDALGAKYGQEGVLRFRSDEKGGSTRYVSNEPMGRDEAIRRVKDAGLPGATHRPDGRLEVIDIGDENPEAAHKAFSGLAHGFSYHSGHAQLRLAGTDYQRNEPPEAGSAAGPERVSEADDAGASGGTEGGRAHDLLHAKEAHDVAGELRGPDGRWIKGAVVSYATDDGARVGKVVKDVSPSATQFAYQMDNGDRVDHFSISGSATDEHAKIEDAMQRMESLGLKVHRPDSESFLTGEQAETYADTMQQAFERYPILKTSEDRRFGEVWFASSPNLPDDLAPGDGVVASYAERHNSSGMMILNDTYRNMDLDTKLSVQDGSSAPSDIHPEGVVWHELGHALVAANGDSGIGLHRGAGDALLAQMLKNRGIHLKDAARISDYAASSPAEAIGEMSSMWNTPGFADKLNKTLKPKVAKLFDDLKTGVARHETRKIFTDVTGQPFPALNVDPEYLKKVRQAAEQNRQAGDWVVLPDGTQLAKALGESGSPTSEAE